MPRPTGYGGGGDGRSITVQIRYVCMPFAVASSAGQGTGSWSMAEKAVLDSIGRLGPPSKADGWITAADL